MVRGMLQCVDLKFNLLTVKSFCAHTCNDAYMIKKNYAKCQCAVFYMILYQLKFYKFMCQISILTLPFEQWA